VGVNAGIGWSNGGNVTISDPVLGAQSIGVNSRSGFVGGGQIGYNFQAGPFVYGLETDIQYANIGGPLTGVHMGDLG